MTIEPEKIQFIRKTFKLVGVPYFGDPFEKKEGWSQENEIGKTWQRFMREKNHYSKYFETVQVEMDTAYELHIEPKGYKIDKKFYVFVGIEADNYQDMPLELFCKTLPEMHYAVFTFKGPNIIQGGTYIWKEWLPQSGYKEGASYLLQKYDHNFKGMDDPNSTMDYLVPVKKVNNNE